MQQGIRGRAAGVAVAAASALALGLAVAPPAGANTAASGWRVVARSGSALDAVLAPTRTSIWVMGTGNRTVAGVSHQSASGLHWNGHRWTGVGFPAAVKSGISCLADSSAGNVWAFAGASIFGGAVTSSSALQLHHGKWQLRKTFTPAGIITGCTVFGSGNAWVYGLAHVAPGVGTWRLRGRSWKRAATRSFDLIGASKLSASDAWADASTSQGADNVVAHWNGHAWSRDTSFTAALKALHASSQTFIGFINAVSPGNVYVSLSEIRVHGSATTVSDLVLHRSGGTWRRVSKTSAGYDLPSAVPDGHGGWWATDPFGFGAYLLHESHGHWKRVNLPVPSGDTGIVTALAHVPGTDAAVAVVQLGSGTTQLQSEVVATGTLPR
jgi:hypothetical protein